MVKIATSCFRPRTMFGAIILFLLLGILVFWTTKNGPTPDHKDQGYVPLRVAEVDRSLGRYPSTPRAVLEKYLRLDFVGANFSGPGVKALKRLNPIGSLYSMRLNAIGVVSGYRVVDYQLLQNQVRAIVEFNTLGTIDHLYSFQANRQNEMDVLFLHQRGGRWIISSEMWPHVSIRPVVTFLRLNSKKFVEKANAALIKKIEKTARLPAKAGESVDGVNELCRLVARYNELELSGKIGSAEWDKKKGQYVTLHFSKTKPESGAVVATECHMNRMVVYHDIASATVLCSVTKEFTGTAFRPLPYSISGQVLGLVKTGDEWRIDSTNKSIPFVYPDVLGTSAPSN